MPVKPMQPNIDSLPPTLANRFPEWQPNPDNDVCHRSLSLIPMTVLYQLFQLGSMQFEQLKVYQHWTLVDIDRMSGITEFSEIMCAVKWLENTLAVDLGDLTRELPVYDLENLTAHQLLLQLGADEALLKGGAQRTGPDSL